MSSKHDLPFMAEYAKSGRSSCKGCKMPISKEVLRLGIMVQSPHFDGKVPTWYHPSCFWKRAKVKTEGDVHGFDNLRWDDQEEIRGKISGPGASTSGGSARNPPVSDFSVEYSISGKASCKGCGEKIAKDVLRISIKDYESKAGKIAGGVPAWHHAKCFFAKREELEFFDSGEKLPGFETLKDEDKTLLKKELKKKKRKADASNGDVADAKKPKLDETDSEKQELKKQSEQLWKLKDNLNNSCAKRTMSELLECNGQEVPSGETKIMDRLADIMLFGALEGCPECKGQLAFSSTKNVYVCTGSISGFTRCQYNTDDPPRKKFIIPVDFRENEFLAKFKFKSGMKRVYPKNRPAPSSQDAEDELPASKPLQDLKFCIHPKSLKANGDLSSGIKVLGGQVVKKVNPTIVALIASQEIVDKKGDSDSHIKSAKEDNVHVVSQDIVDAIRKAGTAIIASKTKGVSQMIEKYSVTSWGGDIEKKINTARYAKSSAAKKDKEEAAFTKSVPASQKMVVKGGGAVDPDTGLEAIAHVWEDKDGTSWNAVLGLVDVQTGTNSYYKLQMLKHDSKDQYWVFRSWGRVGTTIGGNRLHDYNSRSEANECFKELYLNKTGNAWEDRGNFVKYPSRFYPLELDYGDDDADHVESKVEAGSKSMLANEIQSLIRLIFDIEQMKATMKEFEIDLKKMPLGKLSKNQIQKAYAVLTELLKLMERGASATEILDASNRFYTLIPHDFGMKKPPLLNTEDIIKVKTEMLDNLMDLEVAYNLLKGTGDSEEDPLDVHYAKLRTDIDVVDKKSEEFKRIQTFVSNTHASTHTMYELEVEELFAIKRHGEDARYKAFKKLPNRKLLWHGSRVTNFGGILSQGLRIAPPEAPVTGYMFGKGVYFADMVSKSANYCHTSKQNPTGLLLLCEVALGNMLERKHADYISNLPPGKHSTWGQGMTAPDPSADFVSDDGAVIPMGKGGPQTSVGHTSLLYNEFIIYDVAQVNMKYLVRTNFKHRY